MRQIELNGNKLKNKKDMAKYLGTIFPFEEEGNNLNALYDALLGVDEDIDFLLTHENVRLICSSSYAYKVLMTLNRALIANPHLSVHFK